jgi:hypothetical protein
VLAAITASAAGVTATFDAATERIVLTQQTAGAGHTITLSSDTSGFLAATKLSGATAVAGKDSDAETAVAGVAALAGIGGGTFTINGVSIPVDPAGDSLSDLIDRINASGAGVTAALTADGQRLVLTADSASAELVLDDGSSGFFTALEIAPGTYDPITGSAGSRRDLANATRVTAALAHAGRALDALFREVFRPGVSGVVGALRERLRTAVGGAFEPIAGSEAPARLRSGLGIDFDFGSTTGRVFVFDPRAFARARDQRFDALVDFLLREPAGDDPGGLVPALIGGLKDAEADVKAALATTTLRGLGVDTIA